MRMRGKKAIFNYRDTYSLDETLRPIIGAGIKKFLEVKSSDKSDWFGVPSDFMNDISIYDVNAASPLWDEVLEKINYAFNSKEPVMDDYKFKFGEWKSEEVITESGEKMYKLDTGEIQNRPEYERYNEDLKQWNERCQEGYELFGKYFKNLWW